MPQHHRRSVRLPRYDYSTAGVYFVTVCTAKKRAVLGHIENGVMLYNRYGEIVMQEWQRLPQARTGLMLDEFVVMPNHFHAILIFESGFQTDVAHERKFGGSQAGSLSVMIGQLKSRVTKRINADRAAHNLASVVVWQKSFYERIIRDEKELNAIRRYIIENPLHWERDEYR